MPAPAAELNKSARKKQDDVASAAPDVGTKRMRKKARKAKKKSQKVVKKQRERVS